MSFRPGYLENGKTWNCHGMSFLKMMKTRYILTLMNKQSHRAYHIQQTSQMKDIQMREFEQ